MKDQKVVYLRECIRCEGDLHRNRDFYGEYMQCLQCGYMIDVEEDDVALPSIAKLRKSAA